MYTWTWTWTWTYTYTHDRNMYRDTLFACKKGLTQVIKANTHHRSFMMLLILSLALYIQSICILP